MDPAAALPADSLTGDSFRLGDLRIDRHAGEVTGPGGREQLDPKVMGLLLILAENAERVVARDDIRARLWPDTIVTDDVLSRSLYELRSRLEAASGGKGGRALVETLPKRGYRLNAKVTPLVDPPAAAARGGQGARWPVVAAVALAAALALLWLLLPDRPAVAPPVASIAVLPFVDMSETRDQGYLGDGISEEILNRLAQSDRLKVKARTSAFALRDRNLDMMEIARRLEATHILEGSVRRTGDEIRVTAQLIAAADGSHLWSRTYDRRLDDLFAVQDDIAFAVVAELNAKLIPDSRERQPASFAAYEQFLRGEYLYHRRLPGDVAQAIAHYRAAIDADPRYARAWAALAGAYGMLAWENPAPTPEHLASQGEAALKAVALDPGLAVAHARLAQYYGDAGQEEKQREHLARARELSPDDPLLLGFESGAAAERGDFGKAIELARRAVEIDPQSTVMRSNLGVFLLAARRFDEAMTEFATVIRNDPNARPAVQGDIVRVLVLQGRWDDAALAVPELPEGRERDHGAALLYASPAHRAEAEAAFARLRLRLHPADATPQELALDTIRVAEAYVVRGRHDDAMRTLLSTRDALARNHADDSPYRWYLRNEVRTSPFLAPLHADPRWATVVADTS